MDLKTETENNDHKRRGAIDVMRKVLDDHESLLQECHKKPMALSKLTMGMIRVCVLNPDEILTFSSNIFINLQ